MMPPLTIPKQGMKELARKFDAQTIRTIAEVQDQLRHPSAKALARELHVRSVRSRGQHVRRRAPAKNVCHTVRSVAPPRAQFLQPCCRRKHLRTEVARRTLRDERMHQNSLYLSDKFRADQHLSLDPVETAVRPAFPGPIFHQPPTHRE